jgi:hypothetical protein
MVVPLDYRRINFLSDLEALADAKELKPGIVTRAILAALAKVPMLTSDLVEDPRVAALVKRIGLTPKMLETGRLATRDSSTPADSDDFDQGFRGDPGMDALALLMKKLRPRPEKNVREGLALRASDLGKKGAAARHASDNDKRAAIRAIWASGKYGTKMVCAEEEYAALKMSQDTARKALRGEANPDPWPAEGQRKKRNKP